MNNIALRVVGSIAAAAAILLAAPTAHASETFVDRDFTVPYNLRGLESPGGANFTGSTTQTGGNPGGAIYSTFDLVNPPSVPFSVVTYYFSIQFAHDPATQGPIQTLDFSLDVSLQTDGPLPPSIPAFLVLVQNNNWYAHAVSAPAVANIYQTVSATGLRSDDFDLIFQATGAIDTAQHPSFTSGPITFGFARQWSAAANSSPMSATVTSDNLVIAVNTASPVPALPGWLAAMLGLTLAVGGALAIGGRDSPPVRSPWRKGRLVRPAFAAVSDPWATITLAHRSG
jgi:hypothetical protein